MYAYFFNSIYIYFYVSSFDLYCYAYYNTFNRDYFCFNINTEFIYIVNQIVMKHGRFSQMIMQGGIAMHIEM